MTDNKHNPIIHYEWLPISNDAHDLIGLLTELARELHRTEAVVLLGEAAENTNTQYAPPAQS